MYRMNDNQASQGQSAVDSSVQGGIDFCSAGKAIRSVFRARWAEVLMVVVLNAAMRVWIQYFSWEILLGEKSALNRLSETTGFFLGMGTMAYVIVTQMLLLGFLASVVHERTRRQEPTMLLLAGRYFFWRWIRFVILSEAILIAGMVICLTWLNAAILHVESFQDGPWWSKFLAYFIPAVILTKLMVMIPAEMIVRNRMVMNALRSIRDYSLWRIKPLVLFYVAWQGVIAWMGGWMPTTGDRNQWSYGIWLGQGVWISIGQFLILLWAVLEVRAFQRPLSATRSIEATKEKAE